jgi:tetratricopeptide (TPR) repeat protein
VIASHVPMRVFFHFGERTWTTPSLAVAIAVAAVATACRTLRARVVGAVALGAWLVTSIATALPRNFVWADNTTLILHEVAHTERSARMHLGAGDIANRDGDTVGARRHFERAAELAPDTPYAYLELATLELRQRRFGEAAAWLDRAEAIPATERARHTERLARARSALSAAQNPPSTAR